jgi:hypothetical protein
MTQEIIQLFEQGKISEFLYAIMKLQQEQKDKIR